MDDEWSDEGGTLRDLSRPEHLLVWALRAIAVGHGDCALVGRTFTHACGEMGGEALQSYVVLVKYIGMTGRRRLQVHVPGCPCVSLDETAIVGVVAAAQHSLREGNDALLKMRLRFLLESEPKEVFLFAAQAVATILDACGHALPLHLDDDRRAYVDAAPAQLRVVH